MSTDLLTQLAEYGHYHRQSQDPVRPAEAAGPSLRRSPASRPNYLLRRSMAALIAAALVTALIAIPALLRGPETGPADPVATTTPLEAPSTVAATTVPQTRADHVKPPPDELRPMVQVLADGTAVALNQMNVWRSEDQGETWEEWYTQNHEIDLLALAPDGALLAVRNPNEYGEALGPGSTVNGTPEIHRFDPKSETWSVISLPRPELPSADLQPGSLDPEENRCQLGGLQSWVDGSGISIGDQIVILGDHRVVGQGICDEDFQFFWTSSDGVDWTLLSDIAIDGYLTGIVWFGDMYVGYGSSRPPYVGQGSPAPRLWTSGDLDSWAEHSLELNGLPEGAIVLYWPEATQSASSLSLEFAVERYRPGLDESITDIEKLRQWRLDAGLPESPISEMTLDESLALQSIDFPLDSEEIDSLNSLYSVMEPSGTLTLTTSDGVDWEASYPD